MLVAATGTLVAVAIARTPTMQRLDLWTGDRMQRLVTPDLAFPDAVIVAIDDDSLSRLEPLLGAWPYQRDVFAHVADYVTRAGARAIAFDILFAESRPGDAEFAAVLPRSVPVTLAAVAMPFAVDHGRNDPGRLHTLGWRSEGSVPAHAWRDVHLPVPELASRAGVGVVNLVPDEDGVVRRIAALNRIDGILLPALPLATRIATDRTAALVRTVGRGRIRIGSREWPVDANGDIELHFSSEPYRITQVSFARVAEAALGEREDPWTAGLFKGRTVFIGSTALLLGGFNETPMGRVSGVVLAAHAYASLSDGRVLLPRAWWWTLLLVAVALAPPIAMRRWQTDSLSGLMLAGGVGLLLPWITGLRFLAWFHQPASVPTAWLACVTVVIVILADKIRLLRRTRRRLTSERFAAERAGQLKSEFLAHVSHELRTPLTAILGFSRVLADEPALGPDKRALVQIIHRNGEQLLWLVNNLLDQARIAAGQMSIEPRPTAVRDVIEQVLATLAGVPRRQGVELRSSCTAGVPTLIEADGQRLQQILINLAGNALKFTERGSVDVDVAWDRGWLDIAVRDTGPGMSVAVLRNIFEAFNQGDASAARRGGTGLGLTISRNLARLMGGDLTVQSTVGRGSTFRLRVPAALVEPSPAQREQLEAARPAVPVPAHGERRPGAAAARTTGASVVRALIADDSEDIRALLEIYLKRLGIESILVEDGRAALDAALAENPDIVLMDIQMAGMGGIEAVQAMRRAGFARSVLALTAGSGDQLTSELIAAGFTSVIFKPVTGDELTQTVARLLKLTPVSAGRRQGVSGSM